MWRAAVPGSRSKRRRCRVSTPRSSPRAGLVAMSALLVCLRGPRLELPRVALLPLGFVSADRAPDRCWAGCRSIRQGLLAVAVPAVGCRSDDARRAVPARARARARRRHAGLVSVRRAGRLQRDRLGPASSTATRLGRLMMPRSPIAGVGQPGAGQSARRLSRARSGLAGLSVRHRPAALRWVVPATLALGLHPGPDRLARALGLSGRLLRVVGRLLAFDRSRGESPAARCIAARAGRRCIVLPLARCGAPACAAPVPSAARQRLAETFAIEERPRIWHAALLMFLSARARHRVTASSACTISCSTARCRSRACSGSPITRTTSRCTCWPSSGWDRLALLVGIRVLWIAGSAAPAAHAGHSGGSGDRRWCWRCTACSSIRCGTRSSWASRRVVLGLGEPRTVKLQLGQTGGPAVHVLALLVHAAAGWLVRAAVPATIWCWRIFWPSATVTCTRPRRSTAGEGHAAGDPPHVLAGALCRAGAGSHHQRRPPITWPTSWR